MGLYIAKLILSELENHSFNTELNITSRPHTKKTDVNYYTLSDYKEFPVGLENIYRVNTKISFERENKNNILEKNIILVSKIKTTLMRKDKVFSELEFHQPYVSIKNYSIAHFLEQHAVTGKKLKNIFLIF